MRKYGLLILKWNTTKILIPFAFSLIGIITTKQIF